MITRHRRDAARMARSAPQIPMRQVGAVFGAGNDYMTRVLDGLDTRGRCAAAAALRGTITITAPCPATPPAATRAAENKPRTGDAQLVGTPGWAGRRTGQPAMTRHAAVMGATQPSKHDRIQVSTSASCPSMILESLARDQLFEVRAATSISTAASAALLAHLATDPDIDVAEIVAANPATHQTQLRFLSHHAHASVRASAAANPANPFWENMVTDPDPEVRAKAATNPRCDPTLLTRLSGDPYPEVRAAAAAHDRCPPEMVVRLCADLVSSVVIEAATRQDLSREAFETLAAGPAPGCGILAGRSDCPPDLFDVLAAGPEMQAHHRAASNAACPPRVLRRLHKDGLDPHLLRSIASNPSTPPDLITTLAAHPDAAIRGGVAANPSCPHPVAQGLLSDETDPDAVTEITAGFAANPLCSQDELRRHATHPNTNVRAAVAHNPTTPTDVLDRLAVDADTDVRLRSATNVNTPLAALERLIADPDDEVRQHLALHPSLTSEQVGRLAEHPNGPAAFNALNDPRCPTDALLFAMGEGDDASYGIAKDTLARRLNARHTS